MRSAYLTNPTQKWMVCSADGGRIGLEFSMKCIEMAKDKRFADWKIDIIISYYSQIPWTNSQFDFYKRKCNSP
mgnify:CR=1 FL=1